MTVSLDDLLADSVPMDAPTRRTVPCGACLYQHGIVETEQELVRWTMANGALFVGWCCLDCNRTVVDRPGRAWLSKKELCERGIDASRLRIIGATGPLDACRKCGHLGAELHHWAPYHLFGDEADQWPTDYLCRPCHRRWHDLVTPKMSAARHAPTSLADHG